MSASSRPTLQPRFASATATFAEMVLLPTPPLPEPTSTTFFTDGTRSFGLFCFPGEARTLAPKATSTRASCSGESIARTASSVRGLCGEVGVKSRRVAEGPPGPFPRAPAVVEHDLSIHPPVGDAFRLRHRLLECGGIAHRGGVE